MAAVLLCIFAAYREEITRGLAAGTVSLNKARAESPGGDVSPIELPEAYDCRTEGKEPVIKSQGENGTCWAITSTSALEAAFMPDSHPVFSADHMSMNNGFVITQKEGGDYKMIMAYLSGWYGPVPEEADPYGDGQTVQGEKAAAHVQEILLLEDEPGDVFKEMIYTYGPIQTSLYMDRKVTAKSRPYYSEENCAFYYPETEKPTHDVLLLGWDDAFPRENFATDPGMDGAYICQNTWGESFGDHGIFYVSYADANIASSGLVYADVEDTDNYDRIYQQDVCGWQGRQGYDEPDCTFANVYTASCPEDLCAAGFYSLGEKSTYEIYVVHDFTGPAAFVHKEFLTKGELHGKGFFTVPFPPCALAEGERFALMVNISTPGIDKPVAVEIKKDAFTANVDTKGKEGYLSLYGGTWENTQENFGTNICLKAYTRDRTDDNK